MSPRHRRASPGIAKPFRRFAALCFSVASRALRCFDSPPRCRAVLRRSLSLHFKAITPLRTAKHRLRCSYQSIAAAIRGFASPSPRAALLRSAVAALVASWPSYPMPLHRASLPVLHGAVRCFAPPSPCLALLRSSIPLPIQATPFLRSSRLSRASPSRGCAPLCSSLPSPLCSMRSPSIASPSKSTRFLCNALHRSSIAKPLHAVLLLRHADLRKASPLLFRANQSASFAIRPCAMPPSRFLCFAYPRDSAARLRVSTLSHRATVHPLAVPSRSVATLRQAVATPARSRRSTRSGPCRCCATGRCRGTGRSRAIPARAASPTCS